MSHLPVSSIMFHTVGNPNPNWKWSFLTTPWQQFEGMLKNFKRLGYRTVLLDEYKELILSGKILKEKAVALTFDDGYLDNWTHLAPLLEQYDACGTVFMSGDFIGPDTTPRPQWQGDDKNHPFCDGFLNIGELRALDASQVLDVQAHAMTHTWYPSGPKIVDFRHPGDDYHWMNWNADPSNKWKYNQPPENPDYWGEPVYEHQKAMSNPRYFPDENIAKALREHVAKEGKDFFTRPNWKEVLETLANELQKEYNQGYFESNDAFQLRVDYELGEISRILSTQLQKQVPWLCWPGGGYCDMTFTTASKYYTGTTIASAKADSIPQGIDNFGCFRFRRFGALTTGEGENFRYQTPLATCLYTEERRTNNKFTRLIRGGITRLNQWNIL